MGAFCEIDGGWGALREVLLEVLAYVLLSGVYAGVVLYPLQMYPLHFCEIDRWVLGGMQFRVLVQMLLEGLETDGGARSIAGC